MSRVGLWMIGLALLVLPGATARAADVPGYPALPIPLPPSEQVPNIEEYASGWYLRGDIGYRFQEVQGAHDSTMDYTDNSIHDPAVLGFGVGWRHDWFRTDLTVDYGWRSEYSGTGSDGVTSVSADVDSFTVMGNAYVDFGTWYGMTPYIGAGIGGAYVTMANYQMSGTTQAGNYSRWNLAWSVMAGVSFSVAYNSIIDIGYRHVEMGNVLGGPPDNQLTLDNLTGDEIRIGFRYLLN